MLKLIIGNRAYSSWSMRGWLAVRQSGLEFEELLVPMFDEEWERRRDGDEFDGSQRLGAHLDQHEQHQARGAQRQQPSRTRTAGEPADQGQPRARADRGPGSPAR